MSSNQQIINNTSLPLLPENTPDCVFVPRLLSYLGLNHLNKKFRDEGLHATADLTGFSDPMGAYLGIPIREQRLIRDAVGELQKKMPNLQSFRIYKSEKEARERMNDHYRKKRGFHDAVFRAIFENMHFKKAKEAKLATRYVLKHRNTVAHHKTTERKWPLMLDDPESRRWKIVGGLGAGMDDQMSYTVFHRDCPSLPIPFRVHHRTLHTESDYVQFFFRTAGVSKETLALVEGKLCSDPSQFYAIVKEVEDDIPADHGSFPLASPVKKKIDLSSDPSISQVITQEFMDEFRVRANEEDALGIFNHIRRALPGHVPESIEGWQFQTGKSHKKSCPKCGADSYSHEPTYYGCGGSVYNICQGPERMRFEIEYMAPFTCYCEDECFNPNRAFLETIEITVLNPHPGHTYVCAIVDKKCSS